jgi:two-component system copper resistance phosphate regulon response regulator CusR
MKLLLIEDEAKTVQSLSKGLKESGFEVDYCYDGLIGKHLAKKIPMMLLSPTLLCQDSMVSNYAKN